LREPLLPPRRGECDALGHLPPLQVHAAAAPPCAPTALAQVEDRLARASRPAIVAGPMRPGRLAEALARFAARLGIPLFADILSQARDSEASVPFYDLALRAGCVPQPPDLVLRFGGEITSKALSSSLKRWGADVVVSDESPVYRDSLHLATQVVIGDPSEWLSQVTATVADWREYLDAWRRASERARQSVVDSPVWFEGEAVRIAVEALEPGHVLVLGNSRPIRDADALALPKAGVEIHANRGASGIDGVTSTALGHAVASGRPTLLVIGDVSFYHDINGLVAVQAVTSPVVVLLVHNGGGGIFRHLAQAERPDAIDWFTTPHALDFEPLVRTFGGQYGRAKDSGELAALLRDGLACPGL
uniref:thiamine pyrophosphate-dependent enzyme n=1 Tax=Alicyclobacillus sendaiensis TaxID=192387 RepID=UPI0026F428B3